MSKTIRIGIVGFGKAATIFHLPLINHFNEYKVVSVVSSNEEKVKSILPEVDVFSSLELLLKSSETDLIVITTPNHLHYPQAKLALESDKHVVVEKPFVLNTEEGEELIKIANDRNLKLTVFHNRRWDSGFLTLKDLIEINQLGEINLYEARFDRYRPTLHGKWREQNIDGAGTLWDLGTHLIDQALCLFGKPDNVICDIDKQRENSDTTDYFHLYFSYNKCKVILRSSSLSHIKTPHLCAQGTKASFIRTKMDSQEEILKKGGSPSSPNWGKDLSCCSYLYEDINGEVNKSDFTSRVGAYENFYKQLIDSITENKAVPVCPHEALNVVKVINEVEKVKAAC